MVRLHLFQAVRITFLCFLTTLSYLFVDAQDLHFTQYNRVNTSLNPALTGSFDGDLKLTALFRSQWSQVNIPLKTAFFSLEKNIPYRKKEFGFGFTLLEDETGVMQLKTSKALLSGSFQFNAYRNFFRFGIQSGMANKRVDLNGQTFPTQWYYSTGKYESEMANGESGLQSGGINAEVNAGFSWSRQIKKTKFSAGYGLFYLNRPKDKLLFESHAIPYKHVIHFKVDYTITENLSVQPHILYMSSQNAVDILGGADVAKFLTGDSKLSAGAGYRGSSINSDAVYFLVGYQKNRISADFSMDLNISLLSKDTRRKSAWEISLAYTTPSSHVKEKTIPCERY